MKRRIQIALAAAIVLGTVAAGSAAEEMKAKRDERPLVQLAVLLDTSGSMSGMINQAKTQLWAIVNEFLSASRDGVKPRLEVALYQYGTPGLGKENGFIRQLVPLSEDLDKVSEELFKLTTSGGDEYCGWVIRTAVNELQWSPSSKDYKAIFIAGNESFSQGPVKFKKACKMAIEKGIIVNTIHCSGGSDEHWKDGAALADGNFLRIDQNRTVVEIATPFDEEIAKLGTEMNETYIPFGAAGQQSMQRQAAMDSNSLGLSKANLAVRSKTKASAYYNNASWDMVDATERQSLDIEKVKKEDLPEEMREMNVDERKEYVETKSDERKDLQRQITELSGKRDEFVAKKRKELAGNESTLGEQVKETVRKQAVDKGFAF